MKGSVGALDGILLGLGGLATLALLPVRLFVVPSFLEMFRDFGGELPWSTLLVATSGFWWGLGLVCVVLLAAGLGFRLLRGSRVGTAILAGPVIVAGGAILFTLWALYAPIWEMAGNVRAE